jgi:hypothetical protein
MGLFRKPATAARRRASLAESAVRPALLAPLRLLEPLYAKAALRLGGVEIRHGERLVESFAAFLAGRERLILAFRHPYGDEPQLFSYVFDVLVNREARRLGKPLPRQAHARFIHGYEVPLWSGPLVRWILPRVGAVPVYHVRFDGASVARIRAVLCDAEYPLALAPEGQSSYRSETLPRIEKGTARLAFWCAEDLAKASRSERVEILPISVHYRYDEADISSVEDLVAALERDCGVAPPERAGARGAIEARARREALKSRLLALEETLLGLGEEYYGIKGVASSSRDARLDALLETALRRGEAMLGIKAERGGSANDRIARVYRIRQEGWDRIYPTANLDALSELERALADRRAGEAWYAMRHMELVDLGHYLDSAYLEGSGGGSESPGPSFGRLVETAYNLADLASRLVGGDISHRPNILRKRAVLVVAPPIDMSARYAEYRTDRKAAVDSATSELERAYNHCIQEYLHE